MNKLIHVNMLHTTLGMLKTREAAYTEGVIRHLGKQILARLFFINLVATQKCLEAAAEISIPYIL